MSLRFGIPSLDELLEVRSSTADVHPRAESVTLIGPDGCGKSVLAFHLASRYAADCHALVSRVSPKRTRIPRIPVVLYISSDFQVEGARKVWENFKLSEPNKRQIPFERTGASVNRLLFSDFESELWELKPGKRSGREAVSRFLLGYERALPTRHQIGFLDLARHTAGDDWNYVNGLLGQLSAVERPGGFGPKGAAEAGRLPHLVIIDSVAGFETYVGKLDKYGLEQTRRARIAQCMRNAMPHCHLLFVVEEPEDGRRLPEEYVTDIVVRVRARNDAQRTLRTVEVEKARSRNHALGEHPFEIRGVQGSSTAEWENADAPKCKNAYVQVFPALAHRSRTIALDQGKGRSTPNRTVCRFGTKYLDELLSPGRPVAAPTDVTAIHGLTSASTSAIIGDTSTGKSVLAERFIAEGFRDILKEVVWLFALLTGETRGKQQSALNALTRVCTLLASPIIGGISPSSPSNYTLSPAATAAQIKRALEKAWKAGESSEQVSTLLEATQTWEQPRDLALVERVAVAAAAAGKDSSADQSVAKWQKAFRGLDWRERVMTDLRPPSPTTKGTRAPRTWPPKEAGAWLRWLDDWAQKPGGLPRSRVHFRAPAISLLELLPRAEPLTRAGAAQFLIQLFRHPNVRFPGVLLTTIDRTVPDLALHCLQHLHAELFSVIDSLWGRKELKAGKNESAAKVSAAPEELFSTLWHVLSEQLIVRRFDIENATAPVLFHAIQRNVLEAQRMVHGALMPPRQENRFPKADRIRLVIDDLKVLSGLSPSVSEDPAFLPFLTFFLEREGLTTLIVYTDGVRPNIRPVDPLNQTLQSLLKQVIMTWSVPFEGRSRIAVTVVPATSSHYNGIVRELELSPPPTEESDFDRALARRKLPSRQPSHGLLVTRNFELYSGLEEGHPRFVPLAIYLFRATDRFGEHIEHLNELCREMFVSISSDKADERRVVWPLPLDDYLTLRDETHLPMGVQLQYTTVFQVDAFWSLNASGGALASQAEYLEQEFDSDGAQGYREDPFGLFRGQPLYPVDAPPGKWQRKHFFQNSGYESRVVDFKYEKFREAGMPDRVPFTWDFGFLLIRSSSWERAGRSPVFKSGTHKDKRRDRRKVSEVLSDLRQQQEDVTWREFLGAAKVVSDAAKREAGTNAVPFDFASSSSETLNALVLEIWLSEIALAKRRLPRALRLDLQERLEPLSSKKYVPDAGIGLDELLHWGGNGKPLRQQFADFDRAYREWFKDIAENNAESESVLADHGETRHIFAQLPLGALALYRTWLLLAEVLPFDGLLDASNDFLMKQQKDASVEAVAARHWYRTACPAMARELKEHGPHDGMVLVRLPGTYSARGDSFLASPTSSRSRVLAAYAMDLLCSRRANLERLQMGVGLPVRDILGKQANDLPTGLKAVMREKPDGDGELREVRYGELCAVGGRYHQDPDSRKMLWCYRSAIKDYDRISGALQKWLTRLFHWSIALKAEQGIRWRGGFEAYDHLERERYSPLFDYRSFHKFAEFVDGLVAELSASARRS